MRRLWLGGLSFALIVACEREVPSSPSSAGQPPGPALDESGAETDEPALEASDEARTDEPPGLSDRAANEEATLPVPSREKASAGAPTFSFERPSLDTLRSALASVPILAWLASDFRPFQPAEIAQALRTTRLPEKAPNGWAVVQEPLVLWSPGPRESIWIISGKGAGSTVLAAVLPRDDGSFEHGASFIFRGDPSPIAILYTPDSPRELQWTACWSCGGESGVIRAREDGTVLIHQK